MLKMLLIPAIALTAIAPVAAAPASGEARVAVVKTADLDLTSAHDQARLDRRINSQIRTLCVAGGRTLADKTAEADCVATAQARVAPIKAQAVARAQDAQRLATLDLNFRG